MVTYFQYFKEYIFSLLKMSETGSCQNETTTSEDSLMDSVVAATIEDRDELNTPGILCGLKG